MQIPIIASAVIAVIRVLGPTLRFEELGMHHYRQSRARGEPVVSAFWHRCIISATWYWRNRGVVVMNTTNFDGQWTRRVIEHFGFYYRPGQLHPRRPARTGGHGAAHGRGRRLCVYHRWSARTALRRQTRTGDAGPQDRPAHLRVPYRSRKRRTRWKKPGT